MRRLLLFGVFLVTVCGVWGQGLTLEQCQRMARENFPLLKQRALIEQSKQYSLRSAATAYYPQVALSGKATYQSDVTSIAVPGIEGLSRGQFQIALELSQSIWDGGATAAQRQVVRSSSAQQQQNLEVDLYAVNQRVSDLFFGALLFQEQLAQNELLDKELARNYTQVQSFIASGVANDADLDAVVVEQLTTGQQRTELLNAQKAYVMMLGQMVGCEVSQLARPDEDTTINDLVLRPELSLLDASAQLYQTQKSIVRAATMPRFGAFIQGAYGNPGLNMLKQGATPYALGGLKMSWNFGSLYNSKEEISKLDVEKNKIETQREQFLYNTTIAMTQARKQIESLREQMTDDDKIIVLRENIKRSAQSKAALGTMSVTDMLREVTAESMARQTKAQHQIQLLQAIDNYKILTNEK